MTFSQLKVSAYNTKQNFCISAGLYSEFVLVIPAKYKMQWINSCYAWLLAGNNSLPETWLFKLTQSEKSVEWKLCA